LLCFSLRTGPCKSRVCLLFLPAFRPSKLFCRPPSPTFGLFFARHLKNIAVQTPQRVLSFCFFQIFTPKFVLLHFSILPPPDVLGFLSIEARPGPLFSVPVYRRFFLPTKAFSGVCVHFHPFFPPWGSQTLRGNPFFCRFSCFDRAKLGRPRAMHEVGLLSDSHSSLCRCTFAGLWPPMH